MRNLFVIVATLLLSIIYVDAQEKDLPLRDIEKVDDGFIVTYYFNNGFSQANKLVPGTKFWKIPSFELTTKSGKPAIPFHLDTYAIPNGVKASIQLLDCTFTDSVFNLSPALPPIPDTDSSFTIEAIIPYKGFYPTTVISKDDDYSYRGTHLLDVSIQPIQYNYENHIIRVFSKIKYKVQYENDLSSANIPKPTMRQPKRDQILNNIITYGESTSGLQKQTSTVNSTLLDLDNYLIITTSQFLNALTPFVEWKRTQGYDVTVKYPTTGGWTKEMVKNDINSFYQEHPNTFKYLLIVGDETHVPAYTCTDGFSTGLTDLYYGVFDNTFVPEIHRGRIPVSNNNEAQIVLNKIIQYEKTPTLNSDFYNTGVNCAYFQDESPQDGYEDKSFVLTSENTLKYLEQNGKNVNRVYYANTTTTPTNWNNTNCAYGDPLPNYLLRPFFAWNGNADNIIDYINAGAFYVLYRGHGIPNLWGEPHFAREHFAFLENGKKLPIVFSITCRTGEYNYYDGNSFAEAFLKKSNGGCVGIFAATQVSYSRHDDALTLGMFDAIWPGLTPTFPTSTYIPSTNPQAPLYKLGEILDQGLWKVKQRYGNDYDVQYIFGIFHCFGDPSMEMYTNQPSCAHSPSITKEGNRILVHTTDTTSYIVFYDKKESSTIEKYQGNYAEYSFQDDTDSVIVCSYGHNLIPFVQTIYRTDKYIQNETISGTKTYRVDNKIYVGNHVTNQIQQGDVNIINANVKMQGREVELQSGITITNSNFEIRTSD